jgi:hypothetical protein
MRTGADGLQDRASNSPDVRPPPARCDRSRARSLSRVSLLQTGTDIDAACYARRDFVGTAVVRRRRPPERRGLPPVARFWMWRRFQRGAGVADRFCRACVCRSKFGSFGSSVASTPPMGFPRGGTFRVDEGARKERDGEAQGGGGEEGDEAEGWRERGSRVEFEHERARTASTMPSSDVQRFEIAS